MSKRSIEDDIDDEDNKTVDYEHEDYVLDDLEIDIEIPFMKTLNKTLIIFKNRQELYSFYLIMTSVFFIFYLDNIEIICDNFNKVGLRLISCDIPYCIDQLMTKMDHCVNKYDKPFFFDNLIDIGELYSCQSTTPYIKLHEFFKVRINNLRTFISPTAYPELPNILKDKLDFKKYEIIDIIMDGKFKKVYRSEDEIYIRVNDSIIMTNEEKYLIIQHTSSFKFNEYYKKIGETWCDIEYKDIKEKKIKIDKKRKCYYLYWLIANMVPYKRGSASTSKVLLNSALYLSGYDMVQEKSPYERQVDWIAMVNTFEEFYKNIKDYFEVSTYNEYFNPYNIS